MMDLCKRISLFERKGPLTGNDHRPIPFWTLDRKVIVAHVAHVLLLITVLGCGAYWVILGHIRKEKPASLHSVARMVAELVDKEVKDLELLVRNMIASDAVLKYKTSYNLQALKEHLHRYTDKFEQISYLNGDGVEVFRFPEGHPEETLSEFPGEKFGNGKGMEPNRLQVFTFSKAEVADVLKMELAYNYVNYFDENLGSIVVDVSLKHFSNAILSEIETGKSTIAVMDDQGHLLFSTERLRPRGLTAELESLLKKDAAPFGRYRLFGKDSLVSRFHIAGLNWTVLVAQSKETYFADMRTLTWGVLVVLVAMSVGSILLGWYISRGVVKPIFMLNEKIDQVSGNNDLSQRVQWSSRDEFGLLADSYNRMLFRLHEAHNQMARSQEKISYLAFHDGLTGLPNRAMVMQALQRALAQADRDGGSLAVLSIGLDNFKLVNESIGQDVGDLILCGVSKRLLETVRENDFVSRPGGDEFIVFMVHYGETADRICDDEFVCSASSFAERLIQVIKQPFLIEDYETYVSASIGVSIHPGDGDNAQSLVQHAESALYRAKDQGGGQTQFYSPEFVQRQKERMNLATRLNKAIKKNEFELLYQPVVDLAEGRIVGAEALIRWQDGQGFVSPGEFIPLAEETGLILPIGDWVINEACRQIRKWNEESLSLPSIAINLSARQFWHGDIAAQLQKAIAANNIRPESLELEITESSVMKEPLRMEMILKALHDQGFGFALDDFGTGYSSLSRLKHLPIAKLKIDKSFVEGIPCNTENVSLVNAIVQLSRTFGLHVQAEGIETVEQWRHLRDSGCQYGQGYLFSPPVPAKEIEEMVRRQQRWTL